jgi:hypothetical protein
MRILLALTLMAAMATGCGKKKPAASPASPQTEATEKSDDDAVKDENTPAEGEDAPDTKSADPQEGGQ